MKALRLLFFLLFLPLTSFSQAYVIDNFDVKIEVNEDGSMDVVEKISVTFNERRRGIIREIPFRYRLNGKKYKAAIKNIEVAEHSKQVKTEGPNKRIRIGDPSIYLTGPVAYEISYTVFDAIVSYDDGSEVYWGISGNEWDTSVKSMSFTVSLPRSAELKKEHIRIYTGAYGSTASDVVYDYDGSKLSGSSSKVLGPGESMTVSMLLPKGLLKDLPSAETLANYGIDKTKNKPWYIAVPLLVWGLIWMWWRGRKNKNKTAREVEQKFYPPEGLTSAHVGAYIDHMVQKRDVISLIPYWATEGYIKVRGMMDDDMQLIKLKSLPAEFPKYERDFFKAIFEHRDEIRFSEAQHQFGPTYYKVKRDLVKEIENAGYYDERYSWLFKSWRWPLLCLALVLAGLLVSLLSPYLIFGIGLGVIGLICIWFSAFTAPLSQFGQDVHDHLLGLADFLEHGHEDDIQRLNSEDPKYFSHMLPYAVALGLDQQWMKSYEKIHDEAPFWYDSYYMGGYNRPTFSTFSKSFEVKEITRAFTSYPQVDTSSGGGGSSFSSGGGFSGGGFGGGGGSSW